MPLQPVQGITPWTALSAHPCRAVREIGWEPNLFAACGGIAEFESNGAWPLSWALESSGYLSRSTRASLCWDRRSGVARGIDEQGGLVLETESGCRPMSVAKSRCGRLPLKRKKRFCAGLFSQFDLLNGVWAPWSGSGWLARASAVCLISDSGWLISSQIWLAMATHLRLRSTPRSDGSSTLDRKTHSAGTSGSVRYTSFQQPLLGIDVDGKIDKI